MGVHDETGILRVGSKTPVDSLAGAIANAMYEGVPNLRMRAIGHGATGQALKAAAIASGFVAPRAMRLALIPGFEEITVPVTPDCPSGRTTAQILRIISL